MSRTSSRFPWKPRSITGRLLMAQVAVLVVIAVFISIYYPVQQRRATIEATEQRAKSLARVVALGIAVSFQSEDYAAITEAFRWARADSSLTYISVMDEVGNIFAGYDPGQVALDSPSLSGLSGATDVVLAGGTIHVRLPITYGEEVVGSLVLGMSLDAMYRRIERDRAYALLVSLGLLLAGSWLALLSARRITRPLVALTQAAGEVAKGNLDVRVDSSSGDEVGALSLAFAGMVAEVREARSRERLEGAIRLRRLADASSEAIVICDGGEIVDVNAAFSGVFARDLTQVVGTPARDLLGPDGGMADLLDADSTSTTTRGEGIRPTGETFPIEVRVKRLTSEDHDLTVLAIRDLTEQITTKSALDESEERLRQAYKMEAVGQLAGGVAHDFNNLLTVIDGHTELLLLDQPPDGEMRDDLLQIRAAAHRAADVTGQLLAFSRKQVLRPRALDLNDAVANMRKILERLIGEHIDVVIETSPDLHTIAADPGQLDQVILNLAVNARDAMPTGGVLSIAVRNAPRPHKDVTLDHAPLQGDKWVALSVSDTGSGMDEATKSRVFEPFFTTKRAGKGTGLGLATVHGIVSQSGGGISVRSTVGAGTCFTVFLPADSALEGGSPDQDHPEDARGGSETILVVEDDVAVRRLARRMLSAAGYHVLEALDTRHAVTLAGDHDGPIHVLVTDVVMPGASGPEVAEHVCALRPDTRIVFMSGHPDDLIERHGMFESGITLVPKPFAASDLTWAIRHVLETQPTRRA